jgi:hypothetical protein
MSTPHPLAGQVVYNGYTWEELDEAFKSIQGKHWKDPISAVIPEDRVDVCTAAVNFSAGGGVHITPSKQKGHVRLRAPGYWRMIGM